jgi:hypothetical protein
VPVQRATEVLLEAVVTGQQAAAARRTSVREAPAGALGLPL